MIFNCLRHSAPMIDGLDGLWVLLVLKAYSFSSFQEKLIIIYAFNTPLGAKLGLCRSIIYSKLGAGGG